ncbi:fibronectin type III domain-containing protein [Bacillus cytotoxicus]|uniref:Fibronectin type III domain-containing protein n=1 Tax=Bacillus cytotoxicus TaxID=580165 RepID=A0ACC6A733_9BACI|nr:fibronectin type III domain-containing protein [Bacillus cytotoxicus]
MLKYKLHPNPPQVPTGLKTDSTTVTTANISWSPVTYDGDGGIKEYQVFRNNNKVGTSSTTTYKDTGLTGDTTYAYQVKAVGNNGTESQLSAQLTVKTAANPPQTPTGLKVDSTAVTTATISWAPVTYNGGIKEYQVFRNNNKVGTSTTATFNDTGLTGNTTYKYQVKAVGNNNLESALSAELSATTTASSG